jgi:hypothetical protein
MGSLAEPASDLSNVRDDEEATNARPISSTTRSGVPSGTAIPGDRNRDVVPELFGGGHLRQVQAAPV